jgi:hypothetical protein
MAWLDKLSRVLLGPVSPKCTCIFIIDDIDSCGEHEIRVPDLNCAVHYE